ncbi:exported hypothetical protein [Gammaproteobacteria bacterium]
MSKICKLMVFVAVFGLAFVGNAFAGEPVKAQAVAQTTEVAKDVPADANKDVKAAKHKKAEKKAHKKAEKAQKEEAKPEEVK